MKKLLLLTGLILQMCIGSLSARVLYVSSNGSDTGTGTATSPFKTISKAASLAIANDTVMVSSGVYREWVSPANGGISPKQRIVYMAAKDADVWIKGSEVIEGWRKDKNGVWSIEVDNDIFDDYNPFAINLFGDWLQVGKNYHLGEVYIDGVALSEAADDAELYKKENLWLASVGDEKTVIKANFGDVNPTKSQTEINVRPMCFFPKTTGVNYITVKGLKISQAATQWSAPTSEQVGIIGPNWSKGWVIEDCYVSDSKCVGICLGKERASGHNMWSLYRSNPIYGKDGFTREIEAIMKAYDLGWNMENIGSHIVRNNKIERCGQSGIVGHLGAINSKIIHNEIKDINTNDIHHKGAETAGIKLHAAIDTRIEDNIFINTRRGVWLDWQAQGTQVVGNIFWNSIEHDLFIEVSHGPTLVYNNLFLSKLSFLFDAQGIAAFNNLVWGNVIVAASQERYTPYHQPHSTKVKGLFNNAGGDMRLYNNIFMAGFDGKVSSWHKNTLPARGLASYNRYPAWDEMASLEKPRSTEAHVQIKFPIATGGNLYYKGGEPYEKESDVTMIDSDADLTFEKREDGYYVVFDMDFEALERAKTKAINTDMLGHTLMSETMFENPDETPFVLDKDFLNNPRDVAKPTVGAFENYKKEVKVWQSTFED